MCESKRLTRGLLVLFAWASMGVLHADWPQFRGPNRDGKSTETGLLRAWPAGGPARLWEARGCGQGYGSVSIAGGLIYTMGTIGGDMCVVAFDLNGQQKWQATIGPAFDPAHAKQARGYKKYLGSRSTPTFEAGRLYVATPMGDVACVDAATGQKVWALNLFETFDARNSTWAMAESPLLVGEKVIVQPGGPRVGVVALNKATGAAIWKSAGFDEAPGYASPVLANHNGRDLVLVTSHRHAAAVDLATGQHLWKHHYENKWKVFAANPIYHNGHVFITAGYGRGAALLKLSEDGARVSEVWSDRTMDNHHGGAILVDGHVYGTSSSRGGQWICLDIMTGEVKYRERGVGKGCCVYADGMLYCMGERGGRVALVPASPDGHRIVSSFNVPGAQDDRRVWAHPVVCDGRLYIRHQNSLHAYDIKAR